MKNAAHTDWFSDWFDSPYYHVLYKFRDDKEARFFIDNLCLFFKTDGSEKVLDLACGKGRHSVYMNRKGLDVLGADLSARSIAYAQQFQNERLRFKVHDMRQPLADVPFDLIFNLFTSFGYFDQDAENRIVLNTVSQGLKKEGHFVLDFLNVKKLMQQLVPREEKIVDGITFLLTREFKAGFIRKSIRFEDRGNAYAFEEKVRAFTLSDFEDLFHATQLQIINTFGDYALQPFDENTSERLILVAKPM